VAWYEPLAFGGTVAAFLYAWRHACPELFERGISPRERWRRALWGMGVENRIRGRRMLWGLSSAGLVFTLVLWGINLGHRLLFGSR
jgi:hypothetical protein